MAFVNPDPTIPLNTDPQRAEESNAGRILGVVTAFHVLALTIVGLRIYVRVSVVRAFGIEDGFIIAAALCALGGWICLCQQIALGIGHHGDTISQATRTQIEKIGFWETQLADGLALGLLRVSMALGLLRLAADRTWFKWSLRAVIAFVIAYTFQAVIWLFVYCKPFSGWWEFQWMNPFDPRCAPFTTFLNLTYFNISCNIFTDICLGALPVPVIMSLQMKRRVRYYVIAIMNLGYVAVLMGILKAVFMLIDGASPDRTFNHWVQFWKNLQLNFGLIAACASFLKPLLGRVLRLNTTNYRNTSNYYVQSPSRRKTRTFGSQGHPGISWRGDRDGDLEMKDFEAGIHGKSSAEAIGGGRQVTIQAMHISSEDMSIRPDSDSEELILQKPDPKSPTAGIMMTTELKITREKR
ncbi:hypothetical protein F4778DRAFT_780906 [Xylariomycetidae sp. FL2044]|nr:hypothetical protein F4778DRAFT_780906 [Xylariomycetidae sp. FL2044]